MLLVNGGIHMDGFMDTIDALSSHKSRDDKIRILDDLIQEHLQLYMLFFMFLLPPIF